MAWGAAHGWDEASFRVYYLAGALLSAPLLGIGSLQLWRRPWAAPLGLLYTGLAIGVAVTMDVHGTFDGTTVPRAQDHVDVLPRVVAIAGSSLGALAVVIVAAATLRRRPRANASDRRRRRRGGRRLRADADRGLRRVGVLRARGRTARCRGSRSLGRRLERVPGDDAIREQLVGRLALAALERLRSHIAEVARDRVGALALTQHAARRARGTGRRRRHATRRRRRRPDPSARSPSRGGPACRLPTTSGCQRKRCAGFIGSGSPRRRLRPRRYRAAGRRRGSARLPRRSTDRCERQCCHRTRPRRHLHRRRSRARSGRRGCCSGSRPDGCRS